LTLLAGRAASVTGASAVTYLGDRESKEALAVGNELWAKIRHTPASGQSVWHTARLTGLYRVRCGL